MRPGLPISIDDVAERLATQLNLTAEQRQKYDALVTKYRSQEGEAPERSEKMRELAVQFREARRSGDTQRSEEFARQMRELGAGRGQVFRQFMQELEPILQPEQVEQLHQFRDRMRRDMAGPPGMAGMFELMQRLPDELQLTEEQRAQVQQIAEEFRSSMRPSPEQREKVGALVEQLREAREAGNADRVAELEQQLQQLRPAPPDPQAMFDRIAEVLTADQKEKFAQLRAEYVPVGPRMQRERERTLDAKQVIDAAKKLELKPEQRSSLKDIARETKVAIDKVGNDTEAKAKLAQDVKARIVALLDAKQAEQFDKLLQEINARPARRDHGDKPAGDKPVEQGDKQGSKDKTPAQNP